MKATLFLGSFLLTSLTAAVPLDRRALIWKTVTQEVVETVEVTSTLWIDPASVSVAAAEPSSSAAAATTPGAFFEQPKPSSAAPASTPAYTPSSSPSPSPTPSPAPSSSSTPVAVSTPAYTPPAAPSTPAYTPPAVPSSSATPSPVSTPAYTPVSSSAPAATSSSSGSGSGSGSGTKYSGDITYYNPAGALGSCGWAISDSDHVVALAHGMMGEISNDNPWCGKKITISLNGKTWDATIGDKCMGCEGQSIDLTQGLWDIAATGYDGRGHNVEWWVNE